MIDKMYYIELRINGKSIENKELVDKIENIGIKLETYADFNRNTFLGCNEGNLSQETIDKLQEIVKDNSDIELEIEDDDYDDAPVRLPSPDDPDYLPGDIAIFMGL